MLTIDGYQIDVELRSEPTIENEVTEYPVEDLGDHTDNVHTAPDTLTIEGVVTDAPSGVMVSARSQFSVINGEAFARPSQEARARLEELARSKRAIIVESSTGIFRDMVLERLEGPRDSTTGKAYHFTATFKQIQVSEVERQITRTNVSRAKGKNDRGFREALQTELTLIGFGVGVLNAGPTSGFNKPPTPSATMQANAKKLQNIRSLGIDTSGFE